MLNWGAPSSTGSVRFSNKKNRKSKPSSGKEKDQRKARKEIAANRKPVNYGKGKGKRLVQGQSDEAKLSNRLYSLPESIKKPNGKFIGRAKKFGASRA